MNTYDFTVVDEILDNLGVNLENDDYSIFAKNLICGHRDNGQVLNIIKGKEVTDKKELEDAITSCINECNILYEFDGKVPTKELDEIFNCTAKNGVYKDIISDESCGVATTDLDGRTVLIMAYKEPTLNDSLNNMFLKLYKDKLDYINYSNFKSHCWGSDKPYKIDESEQDNPNKDKLNQALELVKEVLNNIEDKEIEDDLLDIVEEIREVTGKM